VTVPLFTIRVEIEDDERTHWFGYDSVVEALEDAGLRVLFDHGLVESCAVYSGPCRITAGPIVAWERLKHQLKSNSSTLLKEA
jgi:hypothetical protein